MLHIQRVSAIASCHVMLMHNMHEVPEASPFVQLKTPGRAVSITIIAMFDTDIL
jgi:hypothetical protein